MDIGESPSSEERFTLSTISAKSFYGSHLKNVEKENISEGVTIHQDLPPLPLRLCSLVGPSRTWNIFRKQKEALDCAKTRGNGLMAFAFQQQSGHRLFLVSHPVVFWHYDSKRSSHKRCTYEIIPENTPCKIYFDLEYDTLVNTQRDPQKIVSTFIVIVSNYLLHYFNVRVNKSQVLILDSSTKTKFSCHLIYQSNDAIFRDNINLGRFVKEVCLNIKKAISDPCVINENMQLWRGVTYQDICDLLICGRNNDKKLFCDESVYSKNRHFRLYCSTKLGKNRPLVLSNFNDYLPQGDPNQEKLFVDSLITHLGKICGQQLEFGHQIEELLKKTISREVAIVTETASNYDELDKFVKNLIYPSGIIRKRSIIESFKGLRLQFDIQGYRYCANVGRHHRSNNIYIILDGLKGTWYQKCHDPDCRGFQSEERPLPPEVSFVMERDLDVDGEVISLLDDSSISDEFFVEFEAFGNSDAKGEEIFGGNGEVPDYGIDDSTLLDALSKS